MNDSTVNCGIHIGASEAAIRAAHEAIIEILKAAHDRETAIAALKAFRSVCEVKNSTIQNCTFTGTPHAMAPTSQQSL